MLNGILLVSDTYNHRVRLLDLDNQKVSTLCGMGVVGDPGHIDGPCARSKLNFP